MSHLFFSLINLIVGFFFIMLGVIGVMIPWDAATRTAVVQFIFENSISIVLFGFGFLIIGLSLVINFILSLKKRYYYIRNDSRAIAVDEVVIQDYVRSYWGEIYPTFEIPNRLTLKKNKIHVFADLPYAPKEEQKNLLENIRHDLANLFAKILGYHHDFHLSVTFQRNPSSSKTK